MELVPQLERRSAGGGEDGGARGGDSDAPQPTPSLSPAGAPPVPYRGSSVQGCDNRSVAL